MSWIYVPELAPGTTTALTLGTLIGKVRDRIGDYISVLAPGSVVYVNGGGNDAKTKFKDCVGYVTENGGTASKADYETIAHGLAGTPTSYSVSPTVADRVAIVWGVNGSVLSLRLLKASDGSSISSAEPVAWRAWL